MTNSEGDVNDVLLSESLTLYLQRRFLPFANSKLLKELRFVAFGFLHGCLVKCEYLTEAVRTITHCTHIF